MRALEEKPLVVVDVGARGGVSSLWSMFDTQASFIGFEPDAKECEELNNRVHNSNERFYPLALYKNKGRYPFYVTNFPNSSGLYPIDMGIVKRFPCSEALTIKNIEELDTIDFDSFASENGIDYVDFMKLDTEGSEFDILEGAVRNIQKSIIGVSCEVLFSPWHKGQKLFADIDSFLESRGFELYNIDIQRFGRKSLPDFRSATIPSWATTKYGQVIFGDALYLRDAVKEIENGTLLEDGWDETKVLKLAALYEVFSLPDCAIELLHFAKQRGILSYTDKEINCFCDLILSGFMRRTYNQFWKKYNAIEKRGYNRIELLKRLSYLFKILLFEKRLSWYFKKRELSWYFKRLHDFFEI